MEADAGSEGGAGSSICAFSMRLLGTRVCLHGRLKIQWDCGGHGEVACDDIELSLAFTLGELTILMKYFLLSFINVLLCLQSA